MSRSQAGQTLATIALDFIYRAYRAVAANRSLAATYPATSWT